MFDLFSVEAQCLDVFTGFVRDNNEPVCFIIHLRARRERSSRMENATRAQRRALKLAAGDERD